MNRFRPDSLSLSFFSFSASPSTSVSLALAGALATGADMIEAATLANHAAGIVVGKVGTATATAAELIATFE